MIPSLRAGAACLFEELNFYYLHDFSEFFVAVLALVPEPALSLVQQEVLLGQVLMLQQSLMWSTGMWVSMAGLVVVVS